MLDCLALDFAAYRECAELRLEIERMRSMDGEQISLEKSPSLKNSALDTSSSSKAERKSKKPSSKLLFLKLPNHGYTAPFFKVNKAKTTFSARSGKSATFTRYNYDRISTAGEASELAAALSAFEGDRWVAINGPPATSKRSLLLSVVEKLLETRLKQESLGDRVFMRVYHSASQRVDCGYKFLKDSSIFEALKWILSKIYEPKFKGSQAEPTYKYIVVEVTIADDALESPARSQSLFLSLTSQQLQSKLFHCSLLHQYPDHDKENLPQNILKPCRLTSQEKSKQVNLDKSTPFDKISLPPDLKTKLESAQSLVLVSTLEPTYSRLFSSEVYLSSD